MEINLEEIELLEEGIESEPELREEEFGVPSEDEELVEIEEGE